MTRDALDDQQEAADYDAERRHAWIDGQDDTCPECAADMDGERCPNDKCPSLEDTADVVWGLR